MTDLFVDDERPAPAGWRLALDSAQAVALIGELAGRGERLERLSLDHDLGLDDETSRPVVLWYCHHPMWWPRAVYVHTANPAGEDWLVGTITAQAPPGTMAGWGCNYWGTTGETCIRHRPAV